MRARAAGRWAAAPLAALVALAGVGAAAGCGIDTDSEPRTIDSNSAPEELPESPVSPPPSEAAEPGAGATVTVWFLRTNSDQVELAPVRRWLEPAGNNEAGLLALLVAGPNEDERRIDVATAIPATTTLASEPVRDERGVLTVDLSEGFFGVQGNELRNAYAQIVCTATGLDSVSAVQFESGGEPAAALDGNGQSTGRPLDCTDYDNLVPADAQPVPTDGGDGSVVPPADDPSTAPAASASTVTQPADPQSAGA
ncbi:MAG TPA: GerMN domain-containing protein [Acidimicrobiales bacterium]